MKENKYMEINEQLLEDILSGKLKGVFVLKNGFKVSSNRLCKKDKDVAYKYWLKGFSPLYAIDGTPNSIFARNYTIVDFIPEYRTIDLEMLEYCRKDFEFMQTLSKAINNMNTLEIEIPEGKEIDWKESEKQNKIVLKDKQLTYEEVCKKLFKNGTYYINDNGNVKIGYAGFGYKTDSNNASTEHQLECILAKNKLANVAAYLNNGWKPVYNVQSPHRNENVWIISNFLQEGIRPSEVMQNSAASSSGTVFFKSEKIAQQAIEILGEETIKLALEPLGI